MPNGNELVLCVLDASEKPVNADGGSVKGQVLLGGKTYHVDFKPAGGNVLGATSDFTAAKGKRVTVKTDKAAARAFRRGWRL